MVELSKEEVLKDNDLFEQVLKFYNSRKTHEIEYRNKNKEKLNEYAKNYYHKVNKTDENPKEKKTANQKEYQKQYRQKQKEKREIKKELEKVNE